MKNIIFDLGGVIIPLNMPALFDSFNSLTGGRQDFTANLLEKDFFIEYELGNITSAEFRHEVRQLVAVSELSDEAIDTAWNSILMPIPLARIELILELSKRHRVFLLSNTNEIHLKRVNELLEAASNFTHLELLFEKTYYSHLLNLRKPHTEIYEHVLHHANLPTQNTYFIDDNQQNALGATKAGIHGIWLDLSKETVLDIRLD